MIRTRELPIDQATTLSRLVRLNTFRKEPDILVSLLDDGRSGTAGARPNRRQP
jgi:hypothetical protein